MDRSITQALNGQINNLKETFIIYHNLKKMLVMKVVHLIIAGAGAGAENGFFFGSGSAKLKSRGPAKGRRREKRSPSKNF